MSKTLIAINSPIKSPCVCSVTQSCPTVCDPMDGSPQAPLSMEFSRQEYWSGLLFLTSGDLPNPGIKPKSHVSCTGWGILYHCAIWEAHRRYMKVKVKLAPTLCNPMNYRVRGIFQARILEWVAIPFSRGSSQPRDRTQVSHNAGRFFTSWATRETQEYWSR